MRQLAKIQLRTTGPRRAFTIVLAALGTGVFLTFGLPLPFLFGPMSACLVAALLGAPLVGAGEVSMGARTILGIAVGASITPEVVSQIPRMAGSIAFVPLYVAVIGMIGVPYFRKVCGFDLATSYYAAMPGGLQDMVVFGQEAGADVRALSLIHATRVLIIVTLVPLLLLQLFDRPLTQPIGEPARDLPWSEIGLMVLAAWIGWKGGERIGLFGATIIGPLIVSATLSLAGLIEHRPPKEAILFAQFFIGTGIGVFYVGVTLAELRKDVLAGIAYVGILALLAFLVTEIVVTLGLAAPVEGFLSFAPGGQAEMTVLAIVAGADLGFIVVHHILRIVIVITGAPLVAALLGLRGKKQFETNP